MQKDGMPPGIELKDRTDNVAGDWLLDIRVLDQNPLYQGQIYRLKFHFPKMYPIGRRRSGAPTALSRTDMQS